MRRLSPVAALFAIALSLLLGYGVSTSALEVFLKWSSISPWYAACGVLWAAGAAAMIVGGLWLAISLGRHRTPLAIGGAGAALSGSVLAVGVLTYVVPCSGPS